MQKLSVKLKNAPRDASQVSCSANPGLNSLCGESGSVQDIVLTANNSEENLRLPVGGPKATTLAYVLNQNGSPLMPCKTAKVRHLLKERRARVVRCNPFTIQLSWDCEKNVQPIVLGIDMGYTKVGFSAVSEKRELISGEVKLRDDVSKKLTEKRMYRRGRRNKLWYRKPKFDNRGKKGWLAPSIRHKLDSHIRLINKIKGLLPISKVIVEVANFDIQKIKNSSIQGEEYQKGEQLGFYNIREYILHRDGHICQHCKGKSKDKILQAHHIRGRTEGATDRPEELMTVCKTCHNKHHKGISIIPMRKIKDFKPETFMSIIRRKLVNSLKCQWTYGYITKYGRIQLGLEKTHSNDAFIIANGNGQERAIQYSINQHRQNNRCLQLNRKGFRPSIRRQKYNFQPHNLVKFNDKVFSIKGVHCLGKRVVLENKKSVDINEVKLYRYGGNWQFLSTA